MDYKQFIVESGLRMLKSGLTVETWGNIAVRDTETGLIYLTPSGMAYDSIRPEDVVVVNDKCEIVDGFRKPTIEAGMHVHILNSRPEINAVVHTHPIYSQVFAAMHRDIPQIIDEAAQLLGGPCRCAEYALPGSPELAENVVRALGDKNMSCLMANHGAVCLGNDMDTAFRVCTVLEMTAQIYQMVLAIGQPVPLRQEDIDFMRDFVLHRYGQR